MRCLDVWMFPNFVVLKMHSHLWSYRIIWGGVAGSHFDYMLETDMSGGYGSWDSITKVLDLCQKI